MQQAHGGIAPFRGQVIRQAVAHDVVSPAYDALTIEQRQAFRQEHPHSYLHVTRSAADEPDAATVDNATLVQRGRAALEEILAHNLFGANEGPAYYVYRLVAGAHVQHGLVCEVDSDHFAKTAKPHEATQAARADLLAEHFVTVKAASSPIACTVRDDGSLDSLLTEIASGEPLLVITTDDGLQQSVWRIDTPEVTKQVEELVGGQDLYIIDGHHRAAANQRLLARGTSLPVLAAVFPDRSLHLVGFHRMLKLPPGLTADEFMRLVRRRFRVEVTSDVATVESGQVAVVVSNEWHTVHFDERPIAGGAQVRLGALDPVVLEREILHAIVGAYGEVDVTYVPDTEAFALIAANAERSDRIPIFVPPVSVDDMMTVAHGGLIMPAKSTYFTPKVRSGVFLRLFDELN